MIPVLVYTHTHTDKYNIYSNSNISKLVGSSKGFRKYVYADWYVVIFVPMFTCESVA